MLRNCKKRVLQLAMVPLVAMTAFPVLAGGLWLNEFGDPSGGRASAGAAAGVDDASTVAHNSASITRLDGSQLMLTVGYIEPTTEFDVKMGSPSVGTGDGGSAGVGTPSFSNFYVRDLNSDKWFAGVSVAALSGAGLDYNDDWVGRYSVTEVSLVLVALAPSVAYKVNDKLSLGASVQLWYSSIEMDVAVPNPLPPGNRPDGLAEIDGDDYDVGFTLGLMYEFSPRTRLGVSYQSEIESSYDSDLDISPVGISVVADLDLPLAQKVRVGLHHDFNDRWGLDFTAGWDDWSTFDHVLIAGRSGGGVVATIDQGWDDTYHVAAGFQYHHRPDLTFTAGIAYDDGPQSASRRTPDLPVDEQWRIAAGFTRDSSDTFSYGAYLNYADLGDAGIENEDYTGDYSKNTLLQISLNFNWKLGK